MLPFALFKLNMTEDYYHMGNSEVMFIKGPSLAFYGSRLSDLKVLIILVTIYG